MAQQLKIIIDSYRSPASMVSLPVRPCVFSSRLMRVTVALTPMKTAKIGSATLEMIYVGAGILRKVQAAKTEVCCPQLSWCEEVVKKLYRFSKMRCSGRKMERSWEDLP